MRLLFLLLGEKVRMRASVKHKLIRFYDRPHPGPLLRGEGETLVAVSQIHAPVIEEVHPAGRGLPRPTCRAI